MAKRAFIGRAVYKNEPLVSGVPTMMRFIRCFAVVLLAACHASKPVVTHDAVNDAEAPNVMASTPVAESAEPPPAPPPLDTAPCTAFSARAKSAAAAALGDAGSGTANLVGFCAPTPGGSWRIDMPSAAALDANNSAYNGTSYALKARFTVVYVDRSGKRAAYVLPETLSNYGVRSFATPVVYDFDNDGEPELYVEVREVGDEGHRAIENALLTFDGTTVKPYKAVAAYDIDSVEDVDGDGRPDLKILAKYNEPLESCWAGFPSDWPAPMFVAHARADGTFRVNDAQAVAYAKHWCPAAPSKITKSSDAICGRMWAKTPDEIAAARKMVSSCVPNWCAREVAQKPQPAGAAEDCERRIQWFDRTPPLTLP